MYKRYTVVEEYFLPYAKQCMMDYDRIQDFFELIELNENECLARWSFVASYMPSSLCRLDARIKEFYGVDFDYLYLETNIDAKEIINAYKNLVFTLKTDAFEAWALDMVKKDEKSALQ